MTDVFRKIYWLLCVQFGFDVRRLVRSLRGLPRYLVHWFRFRREYTGRLDLLPCLFDWYEEGGATKNEYFWQDLYIARKIHIADPEKHVDIGSRIDGFVAHVASFREIEVFDIRPVTSEISGVVFRQNDMMNPTESFVDYCDSLSCLHALEHFGLGRYGDPIDPHGYAVGLGNMAKILKPGGVFYLSVPIGQERVEFNAHRIFNPLFLVQLAAVNGLVLSEFAWVGTSRGLTHASNPEQDMTELSKLRYALGIFSFVKNEAV
jgi:SAM-dependent methyltransferase